jgi:predicted TIM-barrel fold metal-dependent hydrolase
MALNGKFVFDCVAHAFDLRPENVRVEYARQMNEGNFGLQWTYMPDRYRLPRERYFQKFPAEAVASALFVESATDMACYHTVPTWGVWHDLSPLPVGKEIQEQYPGRMILYGAVSPVQEDALEVLEQQASAGIYGVKMYPVDFIEGKMATFYMNDEKRVYPVLERCRELGINTIAIHKALPLGGAPMDPFRPGDIDYAAIDFPDLRFEIVHGGFAFLEETCAQIHRFKNVYINLECNTMWLTKQPRVFAKMLGDLLTAGGRERIFWGTGCMFVHPDPLLNAFENFQFPPDMIADYGYPELTEEIKTDILGRNFARFHGIDIDEIQQAIANDELSKRRQEWVGGKREPWERLPARELAGATA